MAIFAGLRAHFYSPTNWETFKETKNDFIAYNDWVSGIHDEQKERLILHLLTHGLSRKEAEDYCSRNIEIADFFAENPTAGYTFVKGNMITYGKKVEKKTEKKANTPT